MEIKEIISQLDTIKQDLIDMNKHIDDTILRVKHYREHGCGDPLKCSDVNCVNCDKVSKH